MRIRTVLRFTVLAVALLCLVTACATTPPRATPRADAENPAALDLTGVVTVDGDTVRFDRRRSGDPPSLRIQTPRVEDGEVRATVSGQPYRLPVERVASWLHQDRESNRTMLVAAGVGIALVGTALVFVLGGGFD